MKIPKESVKVLIRRTEVVDDSLKLPRPKLTQDVLMVGSEVCCREMLDDIALLPQNQSTEGIEVTLYITKWQQQQTHNSQTFTKNNGQRNISNLAGNASKSNHRQAGSKARKRVTKKPERGSEKRIRNAGGSAGVDQVESEQTCRQG